MNDFQKPDETEIDLIDLCFYLLIRWRIIIACMLIFGLVLGGYKFMDTVSENAAGLAAAAEAPDEDETDESGVQSYTKDDFARVRDGVTAYYTTAILSKEAYMDELLRYMEDSVIMNLDPHEVDTAVVSYYVDAGDTESAAAISSAYKAFVTDGSLGQALLEADDRIPEQDLNYIISFKSSALTADSFGIDAGGLTLGTQYGKIILTIEAAAADADAAWSYCEAVKEAMEAYHLEVSDSVGEHTLSLISANQSVQINTDLESYQNKITDRYSTAVTQMQQLRYYYGTAITAMETDKLDEGYVYQNPFKKSVKYALAGIFGGAFLAAAVLCLIYLMGGRLQSSAGLRESYGLTLLGRITLAPEKKRLFGFIDRFIIRLRDGGSAALSSGEQLEKAAANIRTAAKNGDVGRIMISGSLSEQDALPLYEMLAAELKDIELSAYRSIVRSASALREMESYDCIVFIEREDMSYTELIDEERSLALDRHIRVLGAVVVRS